MPRPVVSEEKKPTDGDTPQTDSLRQRIGGFLDDFIEKRNKPAVSQPGIVDLMSQALDTMQAQRSEEHTSELQSLMRISYAVFCLKKTQLSTTTHQNRTRPQTHQIADTHT